MLLVFALSVQTHSSRLYPPPEGRGFTLGLDKFEAHDQIVNLSQIGGMLIGANIFYRGVRQNFDDTE
ncbi:MAG: hypothetical protein HRU09_21280 [Oligoflexales bacterium]|nr:hypothetical protein [Oligoflexales bacterium]